MQSLIKLVTVALPAFVLAQTKPQTLKVNVDLVTVNARVTDPQSRPVLGLKREQFQIWEDRVEQRIESFSTDDTPVSIGLVLDISGSMKGVIPYAREAAITFLQMGTSEDEFFVVTFNSKPQLLMDFTNNVAELRNRIAFGTNASGMTALYDALYMSVEKVKKGRNTRKAIVTISDGGNNHSRYTAKDFEELMREQDVQVFRLPLIDGEAVVAACARVSAQLRSQYLIGYRSTNEMSDGKWRNIQVKVNAAPGIPPVVVTARKGYYAAQ
jgi:Ca-activated chloride channel homolog